MIETILLSPGDVERMLARRIRAARNRRNWSQDQLAQKCGLGVATIARLERSGRGQIASLIRVTTALGQICDFEAILSSPEPRSLDELRKLRGD